MTHCGKRGEIRQPGGPRFGGQVLVLLALVLTLVLPGRAIAEGDGTPESIQAPVPTEVPIPTIEPTIPPPPVETQAPPVVVPAVPPAPVVQEPAVVEVVPTIPPAPAAVPPTEIPPTEIPPTAVPTIAPTQVPPTEVPTPTQVPPTEVPIPTPTPTEVAWINTDSFSIIEPDVLPLLVPGQNQRIMIRYRVTTPRSATTVYAELRGATQGWAISSPALADQDQVLTTATWIEHASVAPGSTFDLPIIISAPADAPANQTVELRVWSAATTDKGTERGVWRPDLPNATLTVIAPEPTAVPTTEPVAESSPEAPATLSEETGALADPDEATGATPGSVTNQSPLIDEATPVSVPDEDDDAAAPSIVLDASPIASPVAGDAESAIPDVANLATPMASPMASPVAGATPGEPAIACDEGDANVFTCEIDPAREDIDEASISISGPAGWVYIIDDASVPDDGMLDVAELVDDITHPVAIGVAAVYPRGCADPTADSTATIELSLTYADAGEQRVETTFAPDPLASAPSISIENFEFQEVNLGKTRSSAGTLTLNVEDMPTNCGFRINVQFADFMMGDVVIPASELQLADVSGIESALTTMSDGELAITLPASQPGQPTTGTLTITTIMTFPSELPPGGYHTTVTVKAERLQ